MTELHGSRTRAAACAGHRQRRLTRIRRSRALCRRRSAAPHGGQHLRLHQAHPAGTPRGSRHLAFEHGDAIPVPPQQRAGIRTDLHEAPGADAAAPMAVRVQPRQLRTAAPDEPGAVCLRPGARRRNRAVATRAASPSRRHPPGASLAADPRRSLAKPDEARRSSCSGTGPASPAAPRGCVANWRSACRPVTTSRF